MSPVEFRQEAITQLPSKLNMPHLAVGLEFAMLQVAMKSQYTNPSILRHTCVIAAFSALSMSTFAGTLPTLNGQRPIVIGHRGASGYLPEHTLASYKLAIQFGADFVEPDLVSTKDGVLIARHEPILGGTTDVASRPEFAAYKTTKVLDGVSVTDWFASDFTLAEIKTLRAIQPRADRDQSYNGLFEIPTFQEVIDLAKAEGLAVGRTVGIYPETKHPTFHDGLGLSLEEPLVAALAANGWNTSSAPVFIQSFEVSNLQELNTKTQVRLVQLIDADDVLPDGSLSLVAPYAQPYDFVVSGDSRTFADLLTPGGLDFVNDYADGVGPWKPYILQTRIYDPEGDGIANDLNGDGIVNIQDREIVGDTGVVADAHAAGLLVHPFTFRNDASLYGFTDPTEEYKTYFRLGVDGLFSDFPDTAFAARASAVPDAGLSGFLALGLTSLMLGLARRRVS